MEPPNDIYIEETKEATNRSAVGQSTTSWNELRANGVELLEAASSTFPPNDRYLFIRDGVVLDRDQIDSLVTHVPPLYEIDVQPGETWIVRGKDRNAYIPGFDSVAAVASEVDDTGPDGQYVPDGIEFATGYAELTEGAENGFPLIFTPDDVQHTAYKDGTKAAYQSVEEGDWDFNPFTDEDFEWNLSRFAVKRQEFDLYGAGDCTQFLKIRDKDSISHYEETSTVGIRDDPILVQYNLPNSVRVVADGTRNEAFTFRVGPLGYVNRASVEIPSRSKESEIRGETVSFDIGAAGQTVLGVYRIKDDYEEVSVNIESLSVQAGTDDCRVEAREVLPKFLNNLPGDSQWIAPGSQNPSETAIEGVEAGDNANVGEYTVGDVTIDTWTTDQGKTVVRGRQLEVAHAAGGQGNTPGGRRTEQLQEKISEYKYIAILGQVAGGNGAIEEIVPEFEQRF